MSEKKKKKKKPKILGWFGEYKCGCVSGVEKRKKDVLNYCAKHGDERRRIWPEAIFPKEEQPNDTRTE